MMQVINDSASNSDAAKVVAIDVKLEDGIRLAASEDMTSG